MYTYIPNGVDKRSSPNLLENIPRKKSFKNWKGILSYLLLLCTEFLPNDSRAQSFSKFPEPDGTIFWTTNTILLIVWQNNASYTASVT